MESITAFFFALFSTMVFIPLLLKVAARYNLFDEPGGRKRHVRAVPRLGGVAMAAGALLPVFILTDMEPSFRSVLLGVGLLSITGFMDDLVRVRWNVKLLLQGVAALLVIIYGHVQIRSLGFWWGNEIVLPQYVSIPLTFFFILGATNAINFSDGLDGLAAGMCTFIFCMLAMLAYLQHLTVFLVPVAAILGSIWGFLRFNTHPATIFMGDSGSYFLGFSSAVFGIICTQVEHSAVSPAVLLLIMGMPIIDTAFVISERLASGVSVFQPDRRHFHFRLMQLGFSQREAVMTIYAVQAVFALMAICMLFYPASILTACFLLGGITVEGCMKWAERYGFKFDRSSLPGNRLKMLLNRKSGVLFVKLPLYFISSILVLYLVAIPVFFDLNLGVKGLAALAVPLLISIFFFQANWFLFVSKICVYYVITLITVAVLNTGHWSHIYWGMPLWYIIMLVSMAVGTAFYFKFAVSGKHQATPLDLLIFLLVFAFSVTSKRILPFYPVVYPSILSLILFSYTLEAVFNQGVLRKNPVLVSCIISSLVIAAKEAFSMLNG